MYRYVVIDDEPLIRKGVVKKLEPLLGAVSCCGEAADGEKGIELIQKNQPDFVILDMNMPVMGGMELLPFLAEHYPELPLIVISGYQNFDYTKQAITSKAADYLLKPFSAEEIQKAVRNVIETLKNQKQIENQLSAAQQEREDAYYNLDVKFLQNLLLGYEVSDQTVISKKLRFINQSHHFILATLYMNQPVQNDSLQKWFEENGYADLVLCIPHLRIEQFKYILLFIPTNYTAQKHFIQRFLDVLLIWNQQQKAAVHVGISGNHAKLSNLHEAFMETLEALDNRLITDPHTISFFSKPGPSPVYISWEPEEEFLFRVESGSEEKVRELSDQLFAFYSTLSGCTLADVKRHCEQISSKCYRILNSYLNKEDSPNTAERHLSSKQSIVNTLFSLEDVKEYFQQFFLNITRMIRDESVYANKDLIEQIRLYMQKNYQKPLTQEFIASLFYLNRSYLSQIFQQKTGEKFIDYLNDIRIEKAKDLLAHTDWKTYQIAKAVGYDNSKYFFRIFKKKTGLTPEKYRAAFLPA